MSTGTRLVYLSIDLEDFEEQITELLDSVEKTLTAELTRLRGTERIEVTSLAFTIEMSIP